MKIQELTHPNPEDEHGWDEWNDRRNDLISIETRPDTTEMLLALDDRLRKHGLEVVEWTDEGGTETLFDIQKLEE